MYPDEWREALTFGVNPEVLDTFGLAPVRIRKYRDTWRLYTDAGELSLRAVRVPRQRMEAAFRVTEHVAKGGCTSGSPRFIRSRYDDKYVRDGEWFYYLTAWPDGVPVDLAQPSHVKGILRALADWHNVARGALAPLQQGDAIDEQTSAFHRWYQSAVDALNARVNADESAAQTEGNGALKQKLQFLREYLAVLDDELRLADWWQADQMAAKSGFVCHGRLAPTSLRYLGGGYVILDYEHAHGGHPYIDLCRILNAIMPLYEWNPSLLRAFIDTYASELKQADLAKAALAPMLKLPYELFETINHHGDLAEDANQGWQEALEDFVADSGARFDAIAQVFADAAMPDGADSNAQVEGAQEDVVHAELRPAPGIAPLAIDVAGSPRKLKQPVKIRRYRPKPVSATEPKPRTPGLHLFGDLDDET